MPRHGAVSGTRMTQVSFYYDVVCPYSYLETHVVEQAEDAGAIEVTWLPFELRPAPRPLLEPRGDHLRVDWTRRVYARAQAMGVEIHLPRYQPRSTLPLAACLWASDHGQLRAFKHALYEAFFCEGEDISNEVQIARAARGAGLDPDGAVAAAYSSARIAQLAAIRTGAEQAGISGVPSLAVDGSHHWGMGGIERLTRGEQLVPRAV
jgi:predicted DsbA family dithiol-disulfide isomerase